METIKGYHIYQQIYECYPFVICRAVRLSDRLPVILKFSTLEKPSIKILAMLQHEYQLLKQSSFANIIKVVDILQQHEQLILVFEDIDGITLHEFLKGKPLNFSSFFTIAIQLINIISYLHQQHVIHKSLNPNSIFINPKTEKIKLTDFSIATQLTQEKHESLECKCSNEILIYFSPEQTGRMNRLLDYRTDFYSLGMIFYQMLTGQTPFDGKDPLEMIYNHLVTIPPYINKINKEIPEVLAAIVAKLLEKAPEDRYMSAVGLNEDLIECFTQWQITKQINNFALGKKDIHDQLILSQKLYGREKEVNQLLTNYSKVCEGKREISFISGHPGIGKTSIVKEIYKTLTAQHGYFIAGKFDQLKHATPYTAFIKAFQDLVRHLLASHDEYLIHLKEKLLLALGTSGQIICNVVPEMELIIGKQPPLIVLPESESHNRFILTLQKFFRTLSTVEHPLTLFLDDLQWADNASLQLIENLLKDSELKFFFLIVSYRSNEINSAHPLHIMLENIRKDGVNINQIILKRVKCRDIQFLLSEILNHSTKTLKELANLIHRKTAGNPFFINEFIKMIYSEKLLWFSYERKQWEWDIKKMMGMGATVNVVDLLISRISLMPKEEQITLQLAACIGYIFDLDTLARIRNLTTQDIKNQLWQIVRQGFIQPLDENYQAAALTDFGKSHSYFYSETIRYQFIHDRIQQTAYQLIQEELKKKVHVQIGRLLLKQKSLQEHDERLFQIVDHFQRNIDAISDEDEKKNLALYFYWASKRAKFSAAYQSAKTYAKAGVKLLSPIDWKHADKIAFNLQKELAITQYFTCDFKMAEEGFTTILTYAKDTLSKMEIKKLNCELLVAINSHTEAIQCAISALHIINIYLPLKPNAFNILFALLKIIIRMWWRPIEKYELKSMTDPEYQLALEIVDVVVPSAYLTNKNLHLLLIITAFNLNLRYGYTEQTSTGIISYIYIVLHVFNQRQKASSLIPVYQKYNEKFSNPNRLGINYLIQGTFIDPWFLSLNSCVEILLKSYQNLLEAGNLNYCMYALAMIDAMASWSDRPVKEIKKYHEMFDNFVNQITFETVKLPVLFHQLIYRWLTEGTWDNAIIEQKLQELHNKARITQTYSDLSSCCATIIKFDCILGYHHIAKTLGLEYDRFIKYSLGQPVTVQWNFYLALSIFHQTFSARDLTIKISRKLKLIRKKLQLWAMWNPGNFEEYLYLFEAEYARIYHQTEKAIQYYQKAIYSSKENSQPLLFAIAKECAGCFYLQLNLVDTAKLCFLDSHKAYKQFGIVMKYKQMEKTYPEFFPKNIDHDFDETGSSTNEINTYSINLLSILKFGQAISAELDLDKLLEKLLFIILQNAGAQRGLIIVEESNEWYVEAEGTIEKQLITLNKTEKIETRNDIPLSLIHYVQRTKNYLLVQGPNALFHYLATDRYLNEVKPQSILILPIVYQNKLSYIFYLENRNVDCAFTTAHIQTLQLLSSQAIISIENSRLYFYATHDPLTGLANRSLLYNIFNFAAPYAKRQNKLIAIFFLDLDGFKKINDTLGHEVGDAVLIYVANLLRKFTRKQDLIVRLGGDEFVVMNIDLETVRQVTQVAQKILDQFSKSTVILGNTLKINTSIGISLFPKDGESIQTLLKFADIALYQVKTAGKGSFEYYDPTRE